MFSFPQKCLQGKHKIGGEMKKVVLLCLVTGLMITACSSPTPTPYALPPLPTPSIDYQVVGSTKNTFMVVVDPQSSTDRAGLQEVCDYLCTNPGVVCKIWFWDDINKADTNYPVDPANEKSAIAFYSTDPVAYQGTLLVYALGDK
jgi:hypothetical protein